MAKEGNITITNMVYGLGAAIVIVGALFKIQHWPFGSEILTIGMIVEAGVFTYSAFERVKGDLDWSLVYPSRIKSSGQYRCFKTTSGQPKLSGIAGSSHYGTFFNGHW